MFFERQDVRSGGLAAVHDGERVLAGETDAADRRIPWRSRNAPPARRRRFFSAIRAPDSWEFAGRAPSHASPSRGGGPAETMGFLKNDPAL